MKKVLRLTEVDTRIRGYGVLVKAWFKRRILHAPNRIAKLIKCM